MIISMDKSLIGPWICERTCGTYDGNSVVMGSIKDGKITGGVMFNNFLKNSIQMHAAGEGKRFLTRDSLWMCFDYPFNQLKVKKVIAPVDEENTISRKFVEHVGFTLEARIKDASRSGKDLFIYTMTKLQCRWLK